MQGICELPANLQHSILAECEIALTYQLPLLPEALREAALHVAHPSIQVLDTMKVDYGFVHSRHATAFWNVLSTQTHLQELDCSEARFEHWYGQDGCLSEAFLSCTANLSKLASLNIQGQNIQSNGIEQLLCSLHPGALKHLNLIGSMNVTGLSLAAATSLREYTALQSLRVSVGTVESCVVRALWSSVSQLPHLKAIELENCQSRKHDLDELDNHFSNYSSLKEFTLRGNAGAALISILPDSLERLQLIGRNQPLIHFLHHISRLNRLKEFRLERPKTKMNECFPVQMFPWPMTTLHISTGTIDTEDADAIAKSRIPLQLLNSLHISSRSTHRIRHRRGWPQIRSIAFALPALPNLRHITIRGFDLRNEQMKALCSSLSNHVGLHTLDLTGSLILELGAEVLAQNFVHLTDLKTLRLGHCRLRSEGYHSVAEQLGWLGKLQVLDLTTFCYSGIFDQQGLIELSSQVVTLADLRELILCDHDVDSRRLTKIAPQLASHSALRLRET